MVHMPNLRITTHAIHHIHRQRREGMSEIKTPLVRIEPGQTFTADVDGDGAFVITGRHSHGDIIRYVVSDIGEDARLLVEQALADGDE